MGVSSLSPGCLSTGLSFPPIKWVYYFCPSQEDLVRVILCDML